MDRGSHLVVPVVAVLLVVWSYVAESRSIRSNAAVDFQMTMYASTSSLLQMQDQMAFFVNALSEASDSGSQRRLEAQRGKNKIFQPGFASTIWRAYLSAKGGEDAVENLQSRVMEGVVTVRYKAMRLRSYEVPPKDLDMLKPAQGQIVIHQKAPNLLKIHTSFTQTFPFGQAIESSYDQGFDGNVSWTRTQGEPAVTSEKPSPAKECVAVDEDSVQTMSTRGIDTGGSMWEPIWQYLGEEIVNGEPARVVRMESNNMVYSFSKASDLLIKLRRSQTATSDRIGGLTFRYMDMEILMSDYRSMDGVLIPLFIQQTSTMSSVPGSPKGGASSLVSVITTNITRVSSNIQIPDDVFHVPSPNL